MTNTNSFDWTHTIAYESFFIYLERVMRAMQNFDLVLLLEIQSNHIKVRHTNGTSTLSISLNELELLNLLQEEPLVLLPVSRDRRHLLLDRLANDLMVLEELNDFEGAADSSVSSEGA